MYIILCIVQLVLRCIELSDGKLIFYSMKEKEDYTDFGDVKFSLLIVSISVHFLNSV